jgi:riboflavin kinase/FMN adenylyltransferase
METMPEQTAATIGVFDGLHIGHRALVSRVVSKAPKLVPLAVTFKENPKKVTKPHRNSGLIFSLDQKLAALEEAGVQRCVLIDFSGNFSKLAGREFLSLLGERGVLEYLAVGSNFSCGHGLDTRAKDIPLYFAGRGVETDVLEPLLKDGEPVSSSRIRKALLEGRLDEAAEMLGRPYEIDLRSFGGQAAEEEIRGLPIGLVLPPPGIYEAEAIGKDGRASVRLGISDKGLNLPMGLGFRVERIAFVKLTQELKR